MSDYSDIIDQPKKRKKQPVYRFGWVVFWFFIIVVGFMFKTMHWPFSSMILIGGSGGMIGYSLFTQVRAKRLVPEIIAFGGLGIVCLFFFFNHIIRAPGHIQQSFFLFLFISIAIFFFLYLIVHLIMVKMSSRKTQSERKDI